MFVTFTLRDSGMRIALRADSVIFVSQYLGKTGILCRVGDRNETVYVEEGFDTAVVLIDEALGQTSEH